MPSDDRVVVASDADLHFPVLAFDRQSFGVKRDRDELTIVWMSLVRSGWFEGLRIADGHGRVFDVVGFTVLGGVGPLWGFNPFYGRRIRVRLDLRPVVLANAVEEIREKLSRLLRSWHGWQSREDLAELEQTIRTSRSIPDLISGLSGRV